MQFVALICLLLFFWFFLWNLHRLRFIHDLWLPRCFTDSNRQFQNSKLPDASAAAMSHLLHLHFECKFPLGLTRHFFFTRIEILKVHCEYTVRTCFIDRKEVNGQNALSVHEILILRCVGVHVQLL